MGFFYYDSTIWLMFVAIAISIWAQIKVTSTYSKYSRTASENNLPAHVVAKEILGYNGLSDVRVEQVQGRLTDHYDPRTKVLRLSQGVYNSPSVAALGIAAHEVGHAIQHKEGYTPLKIRSALVPVTQFSSSASWILIILGLVLGSFSLAQIGIILFMVIIVFQLVTLPVEFNASSRALAALEGGGYLPREEVAQTKKVLDAAALTYVAAVVVSLLQLLRLILIFGGNRD